MEYAQAQTAPVSAGFQSFLQRVFSWMFLGLLVTGLVAALIGSSESLMTSLTENPIILLAIFGAQIGLVIWLSFGINKMAPSMAMGMFLLYAATMGFTFALVFQLYTTQSIFTTFIVAAAMFGAMAAIGYTTKKDLTKFGPILLGALIALIIATVVNTFVANSALYWITTYAGVLIFAGLTVYDMNKLKQIGERSPGGDQESRFAVMGALALYLDFINMFLFLLRIFGRAR